MGPRRNLGTPIHQWGLRILERKDSRPDQLVNPVNDPLQDHKDCGGLVGNPLLALIVERAVKTIEVQV
jgi:hypothetical protein